MNIGFTFNVKQDVSSSDIKDQTDLEFDSIDAINGIAKSLKDLGHKVCKIEADENAYSKLKKLKGKIDIVFTTAEGLWGDARESQIPLFCEILKIPYTHSNPTTHAVSLNKSFAKKIVSGIVGLNLPKSFEVKDKSYFAPPDLKFPLIIKPNEEGSGKGILDSNIVDNESDLKKRIKIVSENFTKNLIVEEFIGGREFTVSVIGSINGLRALPIIEQMFGLLPKGMHKIAGYELKWIYEYNMKSVSDVYECPAKISNKLRDEIVRITLEICEKLEVRDAARCDFRLNSRNELYFLEINTLPGINPDPNETSCFPFSARIDGLDFKEMINEILMSACRRYELPS